jgi:hypothetical protein
MSGKRAKPSPWRFLRAAPVVVVAVVVWVMVGFFLLLPGSGTDQAHDWGIDPIPSGSDEGTSDRDSVPAGSPEPSTRATEPSPSSTTTAEDDPSPKQAPHLELSDASPSGPTAHPRPRPTSDPTDPVPTQAAPAESGHGPDDNPGKKKGHDKPHGPPGHKP